MQEYSSSALSAIGHCGCVLEEGSTLEPTSLELASVQRKTDAIDCLHDSRDLFRQLFPNPDIFLLTCRSLLYILSTQHTTCLTVRARALEAPAQR
jgi:hypothetical protein